MGLKILCSKNWRRFSLPYDLKKMLHVFMRQQARAAILAAGGRQEPAQEQHVLQAACLRVRSAHARLQLARFLASNLGEDEASTATA